MNRKTTGRGRLWLIVALMAVAAPLAAMADSSTVTYQGILRQPLGIPVADGDYAMIFSIWDAGAAGNDLWTESHPAVPVREGMFSVELGANTALGTLFKDHDALWLEVVADTGAGPEWYGPRMPFVSVPYAMQAEHAESADTADNAGHTPTADTAPFANFAYTADSATMATTATTAGNALRLGGQLPAFYATAGHTHDASAITAGTLSTDRFSAYADLVAESKIGPGAAQVAAGNHNHASLPYFVGSVGGQLSGTKTINTGAALGITNSGTALTAPVTGRYLVHFRQLHQTAGNAIYMNMLRNGGIITYAYMTGSSMHDTIITRLVTLNAGDTISFNITAGPANNAWEGVPHSTISMHLIG